MPPYVDFPAIAAYEAQIAAREAEANHVYTAEEFEEAQEAEQAEIAFSHYLMDQRLNEVEFAHPNSIDHSIPTGDAALDADSEELEYISEMDDMLIPDPFDEDTDIDDDSILATIDFTEEINLNDMYYDSD